MNQHHRKQARLTSFLQKALKPFFAICALAPVLAFHAASAQTTLYWQGPNVGGGGGAGNWDTSSNNWTTTSAAATGNTTWPVVTTSPGVTTAVFGPLTGGVAGGTVMLTDETNVPTYAAGLTFNTNGYNITDDGTAELEMDGATTITVANGVSATITTAIGGTSSSTMTITGGGTGAATLVLADFQGAINPIYFGSSITITGNITVKAAINPLFNSGTSAIPQFSEIILGGATGYGTLDVAGFSQTIAALATPGAFTNGTVTNSSATYATITVGSNSAFPGVFSTIYGGAITDSAATNAIETTNNLTPAGGLGLLVQGPSGGTYTLTLSTTTGANTYHGMTVVGGTNVSNKAVLQGGATNAFSAYSAVNVLASGTLDLGGFNQTIAALNGTGTGNVTNSSASTPATLTLNGDGINSTTNNTLASAATIINGASGSGVIGLTKGGTAVGGGNYTQVLSGNNSYTGATTVSLGTLAAGSTTAFSAASAFTINASGVLDINGYNNTVASLAGAGTVVNGGGNVTGPNAGAATLTVGAATISGATTFSGLIENGTSTLLLTKAGPGALVLSGTSTYTGATTVNQGTLAAGSATGFSSGSAFTVNVQGILDTNGQAATTIASLAGSGAVTNGSGNLGTPTIGNSTLTTGSGASTTFSGVISDGTSGTLALTKIGASIFTLSGSNTYSGGTNLQAGTLVVANSGALGKGNVTVTGGALQAGGTNTNIQVGGNYSQGSGGELDLRIGGTTTGTFDRLTVTGTASLNGRLSVSAVNGFVPTNGEAITVVTSGGARTGTFQLAGNLLNFPMIKLTANYLPNSVVLDFTQIPFASVGPMLHLKLTPNEKAVADALDHLSSNAASSRLVGVLDSLPMQSLPGAYDLIAPAEYGAIYEISRSAAKMEAATIENRLDEVHAAAAPTGAAGPSGPSDFKGSKEVMPPPENRLSVFANGSGEFVDVGNSTNAKGYNFDSGAATVGVDYRFTEHFLAGILLNYTGSTADVMDNGRLNANAFRGGVYASLFNGGAYVNGYVGGAYSDYDMNRPGLGSYVRGSTSGGDFNALIATGYDMHAGGFTYGPVGSFQYTYTGLDAFNESGSLDPLHINSGSGESLLTNVGVRATYDLHIGSMVLVPEVRATWQHEYGDTFDEVSATMLLGSPAFTVTSSPIGRDSLVLNAGFTLRITPDLSAYAYYDGELARSNYQANNVMVGFRASF